MDLPLLPESSVEVARFSPRERVQEWVAERIEDVPQFRGETVDEESLVARVRVQQLLPSKLRMYFNCRTRQSRR